MPQVKDAMTQEVLTTTADKTIVDAAKMMKAGNRGSIVVVENERPIAIVTERDFLKKVVAEGPRSKQGDCERDVMSSPLITVGPGASLRDAAALMTSKKIRKAARSAEQQTCRDNHNNGFFPANRLE